MSKKRNKNYPTEYAGLRYVEDVVILSENCIFQTIKHQNDLGNDCYIEFVTKNVADSFCVFAQIKSGKTYRDKLGYKIPSTLDDLVYWNNQVLPVAGIVFDEKKQQAFWVNITEYIKLNPQILSQKTHNIRVDKSSQFTKESFIRFKEYFIEYIKEFKNNVNFGKSLILFSKTEEPNKCYHGLKSLFSNHRNKKATWHYIITNFRHIKEIGIIKNIIGVLSNYIDNPILFWNLTNAKQKEKYNHINKLQNHIINLLNKTFKEIEVELLIEFTKEGITKGSFSFLAYLILNSLRNKISTLENLLSNDSLDINLRDHYFWLYIHFLQRKNKQKALSKINKYVTEFANTSDVYLFEGMKEAIKNNIYLEIG